MQSARAIRLGLIVPPGNVTVEPDVYGSFSRRVSVHSTRVSPKREYDREDEAAMDDFNEEVLQEAEVLARARLAVSAYGFTTPSFYRDLNHARKLEGQLSERARTSVILPSLAILDALAEIGANKIVVVTPYPQWNNSVLSRFLSSTNLQILGLHGDNRPIDEARKNYMWHQEPHEIVSRFREFETCGADAFLCPCTAWRTLEVVDELESIVGCPVITSNLSIIWKMTRLAFLYDDLIAKGTLLRSLKI